MSTALPPPGGTAPDPFLERVRAAVAPKYEVSRMLGRGGMAAVFLATESRLGRNVALKVMAPDLMADPGMVERFAHEARTTAQLTSPYVVTVYDVDEREGLHFFTMRYVGGRTLGQVMDGSTTPLPVPVIRAWMAQVGSALSHAHRRGVIHRDVKPSNVLIDVEGTALVSDFGIAKLVLGDPNLTQTGQIVGTPTYMSPEQCIGSAITPASDQYAFGAVAYQMVTGTPPFTGPTLAVLNAQVSEPPPPVRSRRPDCPPELAAGIERMLAKSPEERWPGVAEAMEGMQLAIPPHSDPTWRRMESLAVQVAGLRIDEAPAGLRPGGSGVVRATPLDPAGRPLPDRRIRWESSHPDLLQVDDGGRVEARGPGMATVTATCEGARARVAVPVAPEDTLLMTPPAGWSPLGPAAASAPPAHSAPPAPAVSPAPEAAPAQTPSGTRPARAPLLAGAGVLALALAGVAIWAAGRGPGDPVSAAGEGPSIPGATAPPGEPTGALAAAPQAGADSTGAVRDPEGTGAGASGGAARPEGRDPSPPSPRDPGPRDPATAGAAETPPPRAAARQEPTPPPPTPQAEPDQATTTPSGPAVTEPAPEVTEPAPAAPSPTGTAASSEVQQITAIARRLMEAVANQNEEGIRTEYPGFSGTETWWRFAADSAGEYGRTVRLQPQTQVIPIGNTATVVFSLSIDLVDDEGIVATQRTYPLTMRFERNDAGWSLADLR